MKYKIWDKETPLITPTGKIFTKEEIFKEYPAAKILDYVISDNEISMSFFSAFGLFRDVYKQNGAKITDDMTKEQVLEAISAWEEEQQNRKPGVDGNERIALAIEEQNRIEKIKIAMASTEGGNK